LQTNLGFEVKGRVRNILQTVRKGKKDIFKPSGEIGERETALTAVSLKDFYVTVSFN
jgi:hypothetical protein